MSSATQVHSQGVTHCGVPGCPGAAWPWGTQLWSGAHRGQDVVADVLGCFAAAPGPGLGPLTASSSARASLRLQLGFCPLAGHAQSSPCYKYPGAGLPASSWPGGGLLKPNGVSLQLTLWVTPLYVV